MKPQMTQEINTLVTNYRNKSIEFTRLIKEVEKLVQKCEHKADKLTLYTTFLDQLIAKPVLTIPKKSFSSFINDICIPFLSFSSIKSMDNITSSSLKLFTKPINLKYFISFISKNQANLLFKIFSRTLLRKINKNKKVFNIEFLQLLKTQLIEDINVLTANLANKPIIYNKFSQAQSLFKKKPEPYFAEILLNLNDELSRVTSNLLTDTVHLISKSPNISANPWYDIDIIYMNALELCKNQKTVARGLAIFEHFSSTY